MEGIVSFICWLKLIVEFLINMASEILHRQGLALILHGLVSVARVCHRLPAISAIMNISTKVRDFCGSSSAFSSWAYSCS